MKLLNKFFRKIRYNYYFSSIKKTSINYVVSGHFSSVPLLTTLMNKYGSDKGGNNKTHNFSDFYSQLFINRESVKKILEVGLGTSNTKIASNMGEKGVPLASLRAWRDYFYNAKIYGADIDENILVNEENIQTFYVDQTNIESINEMWAAISEKDFDLIVDDGLHTYQANMCLLENSLNFLSINGIYVIEDVYRKQIKLYVKYLTKLKLNFTIVDIYHDKTISNNCIILIKKN